MTNGEKWLAKALAKLHGYCKSRGWWCGTPRLVSARRGQYELAIGDRTGTVVLLYYELHDGGELHLVDDLGMAEPLDSVRVFENFVEPMGLAPKPVVSKRQLSFTLES